MRNFITSLLWLLCLISLPVQAANNVQGLSPPYSSTLSPTAAATLQSGGLAAKPASPTLGQTFFATDLGTGVEIVWNGTNWKPSNGCAALYVDPTSYTAAAVTSSEIALKAYKIPGGLVSANGAILMYSNYKWTGTTGTKTMLVRISATSGDTSGGTLVVNTTNGGSNTSLTGNVAKYIPNNNSVSSQIVVPTAFQAWGGGNSGSGLVAPAVNTASDWYVNINAQGTTNDTLGTQGNFIQWCEP